MCTRADVSLLLFFLFLYNEEGSDGYNKGRGTGKRGISWIYCWVQSEKQVGQWGLYILLSVSRIYNYIIMIIIIIVVDNSALTFILMVKFYVGLSVQISFFHLTFIVKLYSLEQGKTILQRVSYVSTNYFNMRDYSFPRNRPTFMLYNWLAHM